MTSEARGHVLSIIDAALAAVEPEAAVRRQLSIDAESLHIGSTAIPRDQFDRVVVVGAGKAAVPMAGAVESVLGDVLVAGHVVVPHGQGVELDTVVVHEAGHPVPDPPGVEAGNAVVRAVQGLDERTLLVCLISGGGSALLVRPADGLSLADLQATNEAMLACGATIVEINTLRKHLSAVKGGQLARLAAPARVVTLILSDVVGDPLDAIASGPTVPDSTTFSDCLQIVERFDLTDTLPSAVIERLRAGVAGDIPETPKADDVVFDRVLNLVVANNDAAVRAASARAEELGYASCVLSTLVEGETREIAKMHAAIAREARSSGRPRAAPCCLLSGGETTVTVRGDGVGGRNQEFALAAALEIEGVDGITVCSVGTDGIDGPTEAAGAIADGDTVGRSLAAGIDPRARLENNDSHAVFAAIEGLVVTGPTDTNVMDLRVMLVV